MDFRQGGLPVTEIQSEGAACNWNPVWGGCLSLEVRLGGCLILSFRLEQGASSSISGFEGCLDWLGREGGCRHPRLRDDRWSLLTVDLVLAYF